MSIYRNYIIILLFHILMVSPASTQSFKIDTLNEIEFLSSQEEWNDIGGDVKVMMTSDDNDYFWFSSPRGLGRYDGVDYKYYIHDIHRLEGITNGQIITLAPDQKNNRVLLGYRALGFHIFDLQTEKVRKFTSDPSNPKSLSHNHVTSLYTDRNDRIWIITKDGVIQYFDEATETFVKYFPPIPAPHDANAHHRMGHMIQDIKDDHIYWIASKFGIYKFDLNSKSFTLYDIDQYVTPYAYQFSSPIYQDVHSMIWFGHFRNEGIKVFDPYKEEWRHQIDTKGFSSFIVDIEPYGDSTIIATARANHLVYINRNNPSEYVIKELTQKHLGANSLIIDKEKRLHLMSNKGTIMQLQSHYKPIKKASLHWSANYFPAFDVAYNPTNHQYYFGKRWGNGLLITDTLLQSVAEEKVLDSNELPSDQLRISCMYLDTVQQKLWLGLNWGIVMYDIAKNKFVNTPFKLDSLWQEQAYNEIFSTSNHIYFYSQIGILKISKNLENHTTILFADIDSTFHPNHANIFLNQYIFSSENGLKIFDQTKHEEINFSIPSDFESIKNQLNIASMAIEEDTIWLGGYNDGLYKMIHNGGFDFSVERFYNQISPYSNCIQGIWPQKDKIWLVGPQGYQQYDRRRNDAIVYNRRDGVELSWRRAIFRNGHNNIVINPADNSFYYFDKSDIKEKTVQPYLVSFTANGQKQIDTIAAYSGHQLKYNQRDVSFEMGALNFSTQNVNYYRYRLDDYQSHWTFNNDDNVIQFTNLPAGKYTFAFDARSEHSFWNGTPQQIVFTIAPHPLLTWWFKIIWGIVGCGLIWAFLRYLKNRKTKEEIFLKLQKERAEAELKALRAQMNPHFLFNTLNSINWYIIQNNPLDASKFLTKFSKLMRMILDNSKMERISLEKELETLRLYVEIESVRFEHAFEYDFIIDERIDQKKYSIPPLIFQPFFENAIWHGLLPKKSPGKVSLEIIKKDDHLICTIEDNGVGRQATVKDLKIENERKSRGIEITSKRIQSFNGSEKSAIRIIDLKDRNDQALGTRVEFGLPPWECTEMKFQ